MIENPLPVPKKHVPKVLDYKLNDDVSDFDYPVADDDDFDHKNCVMKSRNTDTLMAIL